MNDLMIGNISIRRTPEGLYCLNDFHKAAGGFKKNQPSNFLRLDSTKELIEVIEQSSDMMTAYKTINGGELRGSYGCKELVYAYAMNISAAFHLKVIRAFDAIAQGDTDKAEDIAKGRKQEVVKPAFNSVEDGFRAAIAVGDFLGKYGITGNQQALSVDKAGKAFTGISMLESSGNLHLIAESKEKIFTPTEIGQSLKPPLSAVKTNKLLEEKGLQYKIGKQWIATDKGLPFAEMLDTNKKNSDGTPVKQMKWKESVFDVL